jgi:integrase
MRRSWLRSRSLPATTAEPYDRDHAALAVLLGLNGLRVSEACATNAEDLGIERGHRTLRIMGKGHKPATVPLVPRAARTVDLAVGERHEGPILRRRDGNRLDRRTAHRWVRSIGKRAGLGPRTVVMWRSGLSPSLASPSRCSRVGGPGSAASMSPGDSFGSPGPRSPPVTNRGSCRASSVGVDGSP